MSLLDRIAPRRSDSELTHAPGAAVGDLVFATKALRKFLTSLTSRESPVLLDLGPVVGSNVSFFGEQLGCKIFVEDIYADLDHHVRGGKVDELPAFLEKRFPQKDGTVDGILCWDMIDYLDRPPRRRLPGSSRASCGLTARCSASSARHNRVRTRYTKYIIVDEVNLKHRTYAAARGRQAILLNRDIIRLFSGLRVSDSFLLKNNLREILFRKPS